MTSILERDSFDARLIEFRRIAVVAVGVLVAATAWHGVRGHLLHPAACSSVGCPGREGLIADALRRTGKYGNRTVHHRADIAAIHADGAEAFRLVGRHDAVEIPALH